MPYDISIPGWMTIKELQDLEALASRVPEHGTIVEVGSLFGRSSYALHESMPKSATLYCIDWWGGEDPNYKYIIPQYETDVPWSPCGMELTYEKFQKYTNSLDRLIAIKGESPYIFEYTPWTGGKVDLFFLDANHQNPSDWDSIKFWLPYMKKGAIFSGHDHADRMWPCHFPDLEDNIDKLTEKLNLQPVFLNTEEHPSSIWYFELDKDGSEYVLE